MTVNGQAIRQQLEGIIALLLSLAALAECAGRAPLSVRLRVLSILGPAAFGAQDYVYGETGRPVLLPAHEDSSAEGAADLAGRFRCLAFALAGVAFRLWASRRWIDGIQSLRFVGDAVGIVGARSRAERPVDTS